MEVQVIVPKGTDMSLVQSHYTDLWQDEDIFDDEESYWSGKTFSECEHEEMEVMTYDECIEFCGFVEAVIPEALTCIEGHGSWAMSMIRRRDFSHIVGGETHKPTSDRYWAAHERGKRALVEFDRKEKERGRNQD